MGLVLISSLISGLCWGWTGNGSIWRQLPVRYEINANSATELGSAVAVQVINASYASWQAPACSALTSNNLGTTPSAWQVGDGNNTHIWIYNPNQRPPELASRQTIGVTLSMFNRNGMIDGDILYNGIDHRWVVNPTRNGEVDAQSIVTHEVGHQLGLGHSNSSQATMYAAYLGGTGASTLDVDDIEGICALYPAQNMPQCTQDSQCPNGQQCIGGQCQNQVMNEGMIGDLCNPGSPCLNNLVCVNGGQDNFCTQTCSGNECPLGWQCQQVQSNQGVIGLCLPGQEDQGTLEFGELCQNGPECLSGLCASNGQTAFCTQSCVNDENCPDQATCYSLRQGGGACVPNSDSSNPNNPNPTESNDYGQSCQGREECESDVCVDDGQITFCSELCSDQDPCPNQDECYPLESGQGVCIPGSGNSGMMTPPDSSTTNNGPLGFNEECTSGNECESGLCVNNGQRRFCTQECLDDRMCPMDTVCSVLQGGGGVCDPNAPLNDTPMNPDPSNSNSPNSDPTSSNSPNPNPNASNPIEGLDSLSESDQTRFTNDTGCQMINQSPSTLLPLSLFAFLIFFGIRINRKCSKQYSKLK
jgi:hypothetical protein